jgi:dTDP-glucose pyrophosphorylase
VGFALLPVDRLSFLLFPVETPEQFDSVVTGPDGRVVRIEVKQQNAASHWVWGAFKMPGRILHELQHLWERRRRADEYLGTLVNAWLAEGGEALGIRAGEAYVDVGTLDGYRRASELLARGGGHPDVGDAFLAVARRRAGPSTTAIGGTPP